MSYTLDWTDNDVNAVVILPNAPAGQDLHHRIKN